MFVVEVDGRRHAAGGLHRAQACATHQLFSRAHSSRYFGGFWFLTYSERGPC
jgi:hypothetical protein